MQKLKKQASLRSYSSRNLMVREPEGDDEVEASTAVYMQSPGGGSTAQFICVGHVGAGQNRLRQAVESRGTATLSHNPMQRLIEAHVVAEKGQMMGSAALLTREGSVRGKTGAALSSAGPLLQGMPTENLVRFKQGNFRWGHQKLRKGKKSRGSIAQDNQWVENKMRKIRGVAKMVGAGSTQGRGDKGVAWVTRKKAFGQLRSPVGTHDPVQKRMSAAMFNNAVRLGESRATATKAAAAGRFLAGASGRGGGGTHAGQTWNAARFNKMSHGGKRVAIGSDDDVVWGSASPLHGRG